MSDSEIAQLCRKIYKQHRQALDLIYEHRPDFQSEISDFLQHLIEENHTHNIVKDDSVKKMVRFVPIEWDNLTFQKTCQGWTSSKRTLLFQFWNVPEYLGLGLFIGPGNEAVKQEIYQCMKNAKIPGIKTRLRIRENNWNEVFAVSILGKSDYEDGDLEEIQKKISDCFQKFLQNDLPHFLKADFSSVERMIVDALPTATPLPSISALGDF